MNVIFEWDVPCPTCGWRGKGMQSSSVRVNKLTLRTTGTSIGWSPWRCVECCGPLGSPRPARVRLAAEDAARVAAVRARRFGAAA